MKQPTAVEMAKTCIRLPKDLLQRSKVQAIYEERDFQQIVWEALETYLKAAAKRKEKIQR